MFHDEETRTFNLFSGDRDLIGTRNYSLLVKLEDYPTTAYDVQLGTIEIIDPCLSPTQITAIDQNSPPAYYYTG
jgi:hypothetical protein